MNTRLFKLSLIMLILGAGLSLIYNRVFGFQATATPLPSSSWHQEMMFVNIPLADDGQGWKWVDLPLQPEDKGYAQATKQVDSLNLPEIISLRDKLDGELDNNRSDRLQVYTWAYAVWKSMNHRTSLAIREPTVYIANSLLQATQPPYNLELARMRFLFESEYAKNRNMLPLGEKLLALNPSDKDVQVGMISVLENQYVKIPDPYTRQRLTILSNEILQDNPDPLLAHTIRGSVFETLWSIGHSKSDSATAISEYQKYLSLAPSDDWYRSQAQWWIDWIRNHSN